MANPQPAQQAPKQSFLKMKPLSPVERVILIVVFVALYGAGFYFLIYRPFTVTITQLQATYEEKQAKLDAAIAIFHRLDEINARVTELNAEMETLDRLVPGDTRAAEFLYLCGQWERQTGARVRDLAFSAPTENGEYQEFTVNFAVVGSYTAQVNFMASLEGMDRLVRVDSVSVVPEDLTAPASGGGGTTETGTDGTGGEITLPPPVTSPYPTTDVTTAEYVVHLFVDPSKAAAAADEDPAAGMTFTLSEGRKNPFMP